MGLSIGHLPFGSFAVLLSGPDFALACKTNAKRSQSAISDGSVHKGRLHVRRSAPDRPSDTHQTLAGAAATPSISISIPGCASVGTPISERAGGLSLPK